MTRNTLLLVAISLLIALLAVYRTWMNGPAGGGSDRLLPQSAALEFSAGSAAAGYIDSVSPHHDGVGKLENRRVVTPDSEGGTATEERSQFQDLSERLATLVSSGSHSRREFEEILTSLVGLGTDEAISLVADTMENPALEFASQAAVFGKLLSGVSHPCIRPAATRVLDRNMGMGMDSWYETWGYIQIIAASGGDEAGEKLLQLLKSGSSQVAAEAARGLGSVDSPGLQSRVMAAFGVADTHTASQMALSMASWKDPHVLDYLSGLSSDPASDGLLAESAAEAVGKNLPEAGAQAFVSVYWDAKDSTVNQAMARLSGVASNSSIAPKTKQRLLGRILEDAIASDDSTVRTRAATIIRSCKPVQTEQMASLLRSQVSSEVDSSKRMVLEKLLKEFEELN